MKIFYKQFLIFASLWLITFGLLSYFTYSAVKQILQKESMTLAILQAEQLKQKLDLLLAKLKVKSRITPNQKELLYEKLVPEITQHERLEDVWILNPDNEILFSVDPSRVGLMDEKFTSYPLINSGNHVDLQFKKDTDNNKLLAFWNRPSGNLTAILKMSIISQPVYAITHRLTVQFYIMGFLGVLVMLFMAYLGTRQVHAPLQHVEKAIRAIHRGEFGVRLPEAENQELKPLYKKINQALQKFEQMESVQRAMLHQREAALKELKTTIRYLDIMAHEIKNPLHAMGINLDVLKTKIQKKQSPEQALKHANILEKELDHLQEVVWGFLRYVKPGVPQKQRVNLNSLMKEVAEMVSDQAKNAGVTIETRLDKNLPDILVDRGQIQQALHNLVINALQATGASGKITLRTWHRRKRVFGEIKDTGTGIEKEHLDKIFDLYYTTKKEGSGIGLPITKRIVEANGGELELNSKVGKGTTVTLSYPVCG